MMHSVRRLRSSPAVIVASLALIVAVGGVAYAHEAEFTPFNPNEIAGCESMPSRVIYVPPHGKQCHTADIPISWSVKGRQGTRGPAGGREPKDRAVKRAPQARGAKRDRRG
jgi:hypothetical protein